MLQRSEEDQIQELIKLDLVNELQQAVGSGDVTLFDVVPDLLSTIIKKRLWSYKTKADGTNFTSFAEFVETPLWYGLGKTIPDLKAYCRKKPEVVSLLDSEIAPAAAHGEIGNGRGRGDNIPSTSDRGTSATHAIARLKRDAPELAERVVKGELTANAAALMAGFRRPKVQVATDDVEMAARTLVRHFGDRVSDLITEIQRQISQ